MKTLILGGVRSGKSKIAEQMANKSGLPVTYIATATANDEEMHQRIEAHRKRRPTDWTIIEETLTLASTLRENTTTERCIIVECLTLWLTNLLVSPDTTLLEQERNAFIKTLPELKGDIIFVSNETNMGIMPLGEITRRYCDEAGRLHQEMASICDRVILTVAGLPLVLKGDLS
ncbi:MAG: bifunctional adenosylcobinamide kinase/adenosylcobinamide-phosphate guanylyltransferase [Methylococcales bacterium]